MLYRVTEFKGNARIRGEIRRRIDTAEGLLYRYLGEALDAEGIARSAPAASDARLELETAVMRRGGYILIGNRTIILTASRT